MTDKLGEINNIADCHAYTVLEMHHQLKISKADTSKRYKTKWEHRIDRKIGSYVQQ